MKKFKIKALFTRHSLFADVTDESRELYDNSKFGELKEEKIHYSLVESFFLLEKNKAVITDNKSKEISADEFIRKAEKAEPNFWVRYCVYKDMRLRGYIVKTAFKFGADFRVYDRGVKPGEDHAKWILYPVHESETLTWYEFSAKTRVAHSTRKNLLLGIVDDENDVTYYSISWVKP